MGEPGGRRAPHADSGTIALLALPLQGQRQCPLETVRFDPVPTADPPSDKAYKTNHGVPRPGSGRPAKPEGDPHSPRWAMANPHKVVRTADPRDVTM